MVNQRLVKTAWAIFTLSIISSCCDKDAIPELRRSLYSQDATVRNDAALKLARCGKLGSGAVGRLTELLYDKNVGVQSSAAYALRRINTPEAEAALTRAEEKKRKATNR